MILFIVGPPGVGKSTLARSFIREDVVHYNVNPKWTWTRRLCLAGHYSGHTFDGADRVPYSGVWEALDWWQEHLSHKSLTILDGDRFSFEGVLEYFANQGERMVCASLCTSEKVLSRRRKERGSNQNAAWMKGRATKARNFAHLFAEKHRSFFNASLHRDLLYVTVREFVARQKRLK